MPAAQAAPKSAEEALQYLAKVGGDLISTANLLRRANLRDPLAYRLMRQGLYLHIVATPPAQPNGNTQIPAPPPDLPKRLELMKANGKWPEILEETESSLMRFRFWMDLHWLSAVALGQLGHGDARDAVIDGVHSLIGRMPTVLTLNFGNGSPMCSADAKAWIDGEVFVDSGGSGGGGGPGGLPEEVVAALDEAKKLAGGGKFGDAAKQVQVLVDAANNDRNRMLIRLALAEMAGAGAPRVALGLFGGLARELDERGLDRWDPELAARCLQGLVRARADAEKAKPPLTSDAAFERLCRIDPEMASKLG
jgi:type VI secretion system ImpA/VasJ family protein